MKPKSTLRALLFLAGSSLLCISSANAADGTWTTDANGNWSDIANWNSGAGPVADGADFTALLDDVITNNRTITLDSSRSIGNITAADTTHNYTIQSNTLTLDVTTGSPALSVPSGRTLTITSAVAGTDGFTKTGDGTLTFTSTGTTLEGNVTVSGGLVNWSQSGNRTFSSLSGSGDFHRISQNGTLSILDASAFTGNLATFAGGNSTHTIQFQSISDAVGAGNLIAQGGTGDSNQITRFSLYGNVGPLTFNNRAIEIRAKGATPSNWSARGTRLQNNNATPANAWVINTDLVNDTDRSHELILQGSNTGDNTFAGVISDATGIGTGSFYSTQTGALTVIKDEAGKWILTGANTYTGNTTIANGTLEIRGAGQLGAGGVYPGNITSTATTPSPFVFGSSANTTISGTISGGMVLIKDGAGTLTITGSAIQSGGTTVDAGTLSLGGGTNNANLNDFAALSVATGAVLDLNYSGSDAVFNFSLGGSTMAAGQYGHTDSGADNGGAGVGFYDAFFAANTGIINNLAGDTTSIGAAFWDGGAIDIGTDGDAASNGGSGTWDNTILNWDYGTVAHAAWLNTTSTTAYFGGTAGTVTLGADMNIGNLNIELPAAGGTGYSIGEVGEDNTLTFGGDKLVKVTATGNNSNQDTIIRAGIAGSPTMDITGRNDNNATHFQLLPGADVTQTIGTLNMLNTLGSNKRLILGGDSTGNVVDTVTWSVTGSQMFLTKRGAGDWTITNDLAFSTNRATRLYVEQGTLTLGGTNNSTTHKVGVATATGSTFTPTNLASKLIAKGTFTIHDNREYFFVQNAGTLSPGPGVETLTVTWNTNNGGTHGQFNMQTGSTYEWDVASNISTDVINVQRGVSASGSLTLGDMTIKVNDAGVNTDIAATDQLTVFTYQTGVTRSIGTVTIDTTSLGAGWSGTPSLVDDGTGTIYITGLAYSTGGPTAPYDTWAATNAPTGTPADDFDGDGVSNAIEFVLGGDKDTNDLDKLPAVATTATDMTFTFVRDQDSVDASVAVVIEVGTDLATWPSTYTVGADTAGSTAGVTVTDNLDGTDTITLTVAQAPDDKKFARLKVTITP